jgi:hypothetical protein
MRELRTQGSDTRAACKAFPRWWGAQGEKKVAGWRAKDGGPS